MSRLDQIELHSDRALAELDLALDARTVEAAKAHFGLSELHIDRVRDLRNEATQLRVVR